MTRSALVVEHLVAVARQQALAVAKRHLDREVVDAVAGDAGLETERIALDVRSPADLVDVGPGDALDRDRLPDAGRARIPDRRAAPSASPACRGVRQVVRELVDATITVSFCRPEGSSNAVMSAENGVWPPSWVVARWPLTQTRAE